MLLHLFTHGHAASARPGRRTETTSLGPSPVAGQAGGKRGGAGGGGRPRETTESTDGLSAKTFSPESGGKTYNSDQHGWHHRPTGNGVPPGWPLQYFATNTLASQQSQSFREAYTCCKQWSKERKENSKLQKASEMFWSCCCPLPDLQHARPTTIVSMGYGPSLLFYLPHPNRVNDFNSQANGHCALMPTELPALLIHSNEPAGQL